MYKEYYKSIVSEYYRGRSMKTIINGFYVDGYRNLSNVTLNLHDVTAIVALNNYGKSNLINAVRMGIDFIKGSNEVKKNIFEYQPAFPFLKANLGQRFTFGIYTNMIDDDENLYKVEYRFSFKWQSKNTEGAIDEETLKISSKIIQGGTFINSEVSTNIRYFRSSLKSRNKRTLLIKDNSLAINTLINIIEDDDAYLNILKELNNISFLVEDHLDANELYDFDPIQFKGNNIINVPRMIWEIKKNHNPKYNMLICGFKQLFPNIVDVKCHEYTIRYDKEKLSQIDPNIYFNENTYGLYVTDPTLNYPIKFEWLSDGTKRVLLTLTAAVNANINKLSVMALEEPENSIHPKLLQSYISILDELSGDCKLVFTSHSPYILQFIDPNDIVLGLPTRTGLADFRYVKKGNKLIDDAANEGYSTGEFIFNNLSFENSAEMLSCYLSDSQIEDGSENGEEE